MSGAIDLRCVKAQQALGVTQQAARLFLALLDARGEVRTHADLALAIHAGRFGSTPSREVVRTQVKALRRALAAHAFEGALRSAPAEGYRFAGLAGEVVGCAFAEREDGAVWPVFTVGEGEGCSFTLHSPNGGGLFVHNALPVTPPAGAPCKPG